MPGQKRLPNDNEIVGYHNLEIIRQGNGSLTFLMVRVDAEFGKTKFYNAFKWRKRFSTDGGRVVVFATSQEPKMIQDDTIIAILRDWKKGAWEKTNLRQNNATKGKVARK